MKTEIPPPARGTASSAGLPAAYSVEVLGFNATEHLVLGSIFGLSARRHPRFVRHDRAEDAPDLFLVDADDPKAMADLRMRGAPPGVPVVLIGVTDHGTGWPRLARPLQWARLFEVFDTALLGPAASPASEAARDIPPSLDAPTQRVDRVLVADSDAIVREYIRAKLAPYRVPLDVAASGEEALSFLSARQYGCAFIASSLPGLDGYQVCRILKARRGARPMAVVLMTAKGSTAEKLRGKMAGCDATVAKPLDDDQLLAMVARYIPAATLAA
ncbi:MAG: response regulator [Burkholderiales bacterium]